MTFQEFKSRVLSFLADKWPHVFTWCLCIALFFYAYGCVPTAKSPLDHKTQLTREGLSGELDLILIKYEAAFTNIEQQEKIRNIIFQQGLIVAQGGTVNPIGLVTTLMAILGIGAAVDDIKLRKKIKDRKYIE